MVVVYHSLGLLIIEMNSRPSLGLVSVETIEIEGISLYALGSRRQDLRISDANGADAFDYRRHYHLKPLLILTGCEADPGHA